MGKKIAMTPPVAIPITVATGVKAMKTASRRQEVPNKLAVMISLINPRNFDMSVNTVIAIVPAATDRAILAFLTESSLFRIIIRF